MSDRKATLWISDAQAQAARRNWQRFCQTMRHGPAEHHAASHGYLMGVIDTLGIRSPAALVDALSKITAQTILTEAEEQATIARTLQSAADLVEDVGTADAPKRLRDLAARVQEDAAEVDTGSSDLVAEQKVREQLEQLGLMRHHPAVVAFEAYVADMKRIEQDRWEAGYETRVSEEQLGYTGRQPSSTDDKPWPPPGVDITQPPWDVIDSHVAPLRTRIAELKRELDAHHELERGRLAVRFEEATLREAREDDYDHVVDCIGVRVRGQLVGLYNLQIRDDGCPDGGYLGELNVDTILQIAGHLVRSAEPDHAEDRSAYPPWAGHDVDGEYIVVRNTPGRWPPDEQDKIDFLWSIHDQIRAPHIARAQAWEKEARACARIYEKCKAERDEAIESALRSDQALDDLAQYCEDAAHTHEAMAGTSERDAGEAHAWNRAAEEARDRRHPFVGTLHRSDALARPNHLSWNGTEWVDDRCGCRYHPDDDGGRHGGAPHVHHCEQHEGSSPISQAIAFLDDLFKSSINEGSGDARGLAVARDALRRGAHMGRVKGGTS